MKIFFYQNNIESQIYLSSTRVDTRRFCAHSFRSDSHVFFAAEATTADKRMLSSLLLGNTAGFLFASVRI